MSLRENFIFCWQKKQGKEDMWKYAVNKNKLFSENFDHQKLLLNKLANTWEKKLDTQISHIDWPLAHLQEDE